MKALKNENEAIKAFIELEKKSRPYFTQRSLKYAYEKALASTGNAIYSKRTDIASKTEPAFKKLLNQAFDMVMQGIPLDPQKENTLTQAQAAAKYSLSEESGANTHLTTLIIEKSSVLKNIQRLSQAPSNESKALIEKEKNKIKELDTKLIQIKKALDAPEKEREKEAQQERIEEERQRRAEDEKEDAQKRKEQAVAKEKVKEIKKQTTKEETDFEAREKARIEREKGEELERRGQIAAERAAEL